MQKVLKMFCSLIFLISASLILFACQGKVVYLPKPTVFGWTNNAEVLQDEEGKVILDEEGNKCFGASKYILVTSTCVGTSEYRFYLTNSENYEEMTNYVAYSSTTNYIDVTEKIDPKKSWHFCVQYVGSGRYKSSPISDIKELRPEGVEKVASPYAQLSENRIVWSNVQNATSYEVYEKVLDASGNVLVENTLVYNADATSLSYYYYDPQTNSTSELSPYKKYVYSIQAISSGYYLSSDLSNEVTFIKPITLEKVTNISVNVKSKTLTWQKVKYATKYEISVENSTGESKKYYSETESYDLSEILSSYTTYSFSVKAIESDVLKYEKGSVSDVVSADYTTNLNAPQNLQAVLVGEDITVSFDAVTLGEKYTLEISWNNNSFVFTKSELESTNGKITFTLSYDDLKENGTLFASSNTEKLTIKVKANAINQYYLDSDFTQTTFEITKQQATG